MKLTQGLNFINILSTAFTHVDPEGTKKDSQVSKCHLVLLGPKSIKAARKMFIKFTQGLNLLHALLYGDHDGLVDKYHEGAVASEVAALVHYGTTVRHFELFCEGITTVVLNLL